MVNVKKLRGKIVENGYTQKELAVSIGISNRTFTSRMARKVFGSDEMKNVSCNLRETFFLARQRERGHPGCCYDIIHSTAAVTRAAGGSIEDHILGAQRLRSRA